MHKLYQWLRKRASFFRSDKPIPGTSRTVRTEVTVERQRMTVLVGGAAAGSDLCPLCGQKVEPAQAEPPKLRLQEGATPKDDVLGNGTAP